MPLITPYLKKSSGSESDGGCRSLAGSWYAEGPGCGSSFLGIVMGQEGTKAAWINHLCKRPVKYQWCLSALQMTFFSSRFPAKV